MSARKAGAEKVYEAASIWVDRALRSDDSLFTPGEAIWSSRWLGELHERFLDQPDLGSGSFYEKLRTQLTGSPREIYQLMGEVLYVHFLIIWRGGMRGDTKENRINQVLGWSGHGMTIPSSLVAGLTPGIANIGQARARYFPFHVGFVIELVEQWKKREPSELRRLLEEPWEFKEFATQLDLRGELFREAPYAHSVQLDAFLHLVFPDTFEGIVSARDKRLIAEAKAYTDFVSEQTTDVDCKLIQIRRGLEAEHAKEGFDFYDPDINVQWSTNVNPWDEFVRRAQQYVDTGRLGRDEIPSKLETGRRLTTAREAVIAESNDWAELLRRGLSGQLISPRYALPKIYGWIDESPDEALRALQAIWRRNASSVIERIRAFSRLFPRSVMSGSGTRMNVISVLLMGLDVEKYPPFMTTAFNNAYKRTEYQAPARAADEGTLYEHALRFLDQLIKEASERGLTLRHRLDSQSAVWGVVGDFWGIPDGDDGLGVLAGEVFLPVEFLREIEELLGEKGQVIFQGPPGTGKTYIAQALARHLAGSEERVTLVQLHPSYAYEDFVQGYRPMLRDGQAGFEMREGPLLRAAERARRDSSHKHFLVIDEINRGNIAKVFGELYFLLEYRDREMQLQYSDRPFSLPKNLYIIGR